MIIFDLDGTLTDCEHRRHFVDPEKYPDLCEYSNYRIIDGQPFLDLGGKSSWRYKETGESFVSGFKSFYEACDEDKLIIQTRGLFDFIGMNGYPNKLKIWSSRCDSVREKTKIWLKNYTFAYATHEFNIELKMRPIGGLNARLRS